MSKIVDVTAYISTKDRYDTTLPLAIASIAMQTVSPKKFILFEDSEPVDIRTNSVYLHLLHMLTPEIYAGGRPAPTPQDYLHV